MQDFPVSNQCALMLLSCQKNFISFKVHTSSANAKDIVLEAAKFERVFILSCQICLLMWGMEHVLHIERRVVLSPESYDVLVMGETHEAC